MPNEMKAIIDNCTITSYDASNAFLKKIWQKFIFTHLSERFALLATPTIYDFWLARRWCETRFDSNFNLLFSYQIRMSTWLPFSLQLVEDRLIMKLLTSKAFKLTMIEIQSLILNQPQQHNFSIRTIVMIESLKMNWDLWSKNLNV